MRIVWFSHRYAPCIGGAEGYSRAIVRRFVEAGHKVDVVTSDAEELWYFTDRRRRRLAEPQEDWVDGARVRRLPVRHIPFQRYWGRLLSYAPHWPTRCRIASYMPIIPGIERIRGNYDAVFAVGFPFTLFSYAALKTARAAGAPLVLTPFLHLATPGDVVNRHYTRPHQIRLLGQADTVITPTSLEARTIASWGISEARLLTLPMAVEHAEVTGGARHRLRDRLGIPDGRLVVGKLGALHPNKGTHDLVRAVERLNAQRSAASLIHLVLAGANSPEFEAFAAQLDRGTRRWLTILGPVPPADLPDFYAALDLFAMPSRTDSFGIVYLEAWANGKPVVAAAAGGVTEVVRHEETGLLVPFGNVGRLAEAINELVSDRAKAQRLGQAGLAQVSRGCTWDDRFAVLHEHTQKLVRLRETHTPHSYRSIHVAAAHINGAAESGP
jgi:glycosyltransferase involved in cell wall biosynthesis